VDGPATAKLQGP